MNSELLKGIFVRLRRDGSAAFVISAAAFYAADHYYQLQNLSFAGMAGFVGPIATIACLYQWPRETRKNKLLVKLEQQKENLKFIEFPLPGSDLSAQGLSRYLSAVEVEIKAYRLEFRRKALLLLAFGAFFLASSLLAMLYPSITAFETEALCVTGGLLMFSGFVISYYKSDPGLENLKRQVDRAQALFDKIDLKKIIEEEGKKIDQAVLGPVVIQIVVLEAVWKPVVLDQPKCIEDKGKQIDKAVDGQ